MDVQTYPRGGIGAITIHFGLPEYECSCGRCPETLVDREHVERLEALRSALRLPIIITSAYRCRAHNRAIGGHRTSKHMLGVATDIVVRGASPDEVADLAEGMGFAGLGRYDTFTHVDSRDLAYRDGRPARWDQRTRGGA